MNKQKMEMPVNTIKTIIISRRPLKYIGIIGAVASAAITFFKPETSSYISETIAWLTCAAALYLI